MRGEAVDAAADAARHAEGETTCPTAHRGGVSGDGPAFGDADAAVTDTEDTLDGY